MIALKKRIIGATFLAVVVALVISNLVGIWVFRMREIDAARQNLEELLILMDAQSAITDPQGVTDQFRQAAPDKRLTIIDTDGAVLADTEVNPDNLGSHEDRPEVTMARAAGWGEATRRSDTTGETMNEREARSVLGRNEEDLRTLYLEGNRAKFDALVLEQLGSDDAYHAAKAEDGDAGEDEPSGEAEAE